MKNYELQNPVTVDGEKVTEIELSRPMKIREVAELQDADQNIRKQVQVLAPFLGVKEGVLYELDADDFVGLTLRIGGEEKKPSA